MAKFDIKALNQMIEDQLQPKPKTTVAGYNPLERLLYRMREKRGLK